MQPEFSSCRLDAFQDILQLIEVVVDYVDVIHIPAIIFTASDDFAVVVYPCRKEYAYILRYLIAYLYRFRHVFLAGHQAFRHRLIILHAVELSRIFEALPSRRFLSWMHGKSRTVD